jgi:TetR/AcrR family transcriptional repressor of nem operon
MSRPSHRERILELGFDLVLQKGYGASSVRDITTAAGVPNGSFTNHFASKEEFAIAILDKFQHQAEELASVTLLDRSLSPRQRILAYADAAIAGLRASGVNHGCMAGNFGMEASTSSPAIRAKVAEHFIWMEQLLSETLSEAYHLEDELPTQPVSEMASFIVASMQGATLLAKTKQSMEPINMWRKTLVATLLTPLLERDCA